MFMNFKKSTTTFYLGLIVSLCIFDVQLALSSDTCHSSCLTCSGPAENQCLSCNEDSLITKTGYCVEQCETPLIIDINDRVECNSPCQADSFIYADLSCARFCNAPLQQSEFAGYKFCIERCSGNQYWDPESNSCQSCHSSCLTCSGSAEDKCLSCNAGYFITETGYCVDKCESPLMLEVINHDLIQCNSPCRAGSFIYADQSCARFCHAPLEKLQFLGYNFCLLIDHGEGGEAEEVGENEEEFIIFEEGSLGGEESPQLDLLNSDIILEGWTANDDGSNE